jgi:hypothetical protein
LDADLFVHVRVLVGMVVSLGIAKLLTGLVGFVQHPTRTKTYGVHLAWSASMLLMLVHFWWWEFRLSHLQGWHFATYAFVVYYAVMFFALCALLFPDNVDEYDGYEGYFHSRRRWFFGLLAFTFALDFVDAAIKGQARILELGIEFPIRNAAYIILCAVAALVRNETFHRVFAGANLVYQVYWIHRTYETLS